MQRFFLNARECGSTQNRNRYFQFGSKLGFVLDIKRQPKAKQAQPCAMATEGTKQTRRTWAQFCELQGIAQPFDLPELTKAAAYKVVGNAVSLHVSRTVAAAINDAHDSPVFWHQVKTCECGCGRIVSKNRKTANDACRKRLNVNRRQATSAAA